MPALREASDANGGERRERTPAEESAGEASSLAARARAAPQPEPAALQPAPEAASPLPSAGTGAAALEVHGEQVEMRLGERFWRVRGLAKNTSLEQLRVNVLCARGDAFHLDTLDLYSARQRAAYVKQAASELGLEEELVKRDLGRLLLGVEELHERKVQEALAPKQPQVTLSEEQRAEALSLLRDPQLLERILGDFERSGVVGERSNKLIGYLAAVSRKLEEPLAIIIQSSSAAGKTSLMEAVLSFMPEEDRVKYSAMTGQSLFYMGGRDLRHKILAIVEEEGAQKASYALKLLQSEGELCIASTGKDPVSGRLVTQEYRVEGPVMILLTTTAIEIDEELQNRCIVLTVDEEREQTQAIHRLQRESRTLSGLRARHERQRVLALHQNAQRLLRPLEVVNPYARELTFLDDRTRTRRDHLKYLTLIEAIALLHQHQRSVKSERLEGQEVLYVEVEPGDIELANRLAAEAFGRSLDELPPQTRRLLMLLEQMVKDECARVRVERSEYRFRARDVREKTGWGATQLKVHLGRLVEMEYLLVHRARRGQGFCYELLYEGQGKDGRPFVLKLLDPKKLGKGAERCGYDVERSALEEERSGLEEERSELEEERPGLGRPLVGAWPGPGRGEAEADENGLEGVFSGGLAKNARFGTAPETAAPLRAGRNGSGSARAQKRA